MSYSAYIALFVSVCALAVTFYSMWTNRKAVAVASYLETSRRISDAWWKTLIEKRKIGRNMDEELSNMGFQWSLHELLILIEDACLLLRKNMYVVLGEEVKKLIDNHVRTLIDDTHVQDYIRDRVTEQSDSFSEIKKFCDKNGVEGFPDP